MDVCTISKVVKRTGASQKQIRDWTKRGYLGTVVKEESLGFTVYIYSKANVERAKKIVEYKEEGYTPKAAALILDEEDSNGSN